MTFMTIVQCEERGEPLHSTMINNVSERVHKFTQHCFQKSSSRDKPLT